MLTVLTHLVFVRVEATLTSTVRAVRAAARARSRAD